MKSLWINRIMASILVFGVAMGMFNIPLANASGGFAFVEKLIAKDKKQLAHIAKNMDGSLFRKGLPNAGTLSKKFGIPAKMLQSPAVRKLAIAGEKVALHSPFAKKMLNQSKYPERVIKQSMHYGTDSYMSVAKAVKHQMTTSKTVNLNVLSQLKGKYKGMNEVINKFNAGHYDSDIFVRTIRKTGKHGMKIMGWLVKHPKSTAAGAAMIWYSYDPEGFEEALTKSGKTLAAFVGESVMNVSAGVGEGITQGLTKSLDAHSMKYVILGALAIVLVVLIALSKTFRRILLFPFTILGKKANEKMDTVEQRPRQKPTRRTEETKGSASRKTKSNL